MSAILTVTNIEKRFGSKLVVDCVSFQAKRGECLGIVGPNGAGKTTLFNLLDGTIRPDSGAVSVGNADVTALAQYRRARLGIGRAFQVPRTFIGLTVFENVLAGVTHGAGFRGASARERTSEILEITGLSEKSERVAGALPLLDRKRLELAKAMSVGTRLLLLDEIAGGLTEQEVLELVEVVRRLKKDLAVLWIEHIPHALIAVSDRIMVLHFGRKLLDGDPRTVRDSTLVQEIYLGISPDVAAAS